MTREYNDEFEEVKGTLKRTTPKAMLVEIDKEDHWFPFSQVELSEAIKPGPIEFLASKWILEQKGLA